MSVFLTLSALQGTPLRTMSSLVVANRIVNRRCVDKYKFIQIKTR